MSTHTTSIPGEAVSKFFENPRTFLTANDNITLRTSPGTIGVSRNRLRTLIQENGAEHQPNSSITAGG